MAIARWDPLSEFRTLTRRMERAFEPFGIGMPSEAGMGMGTELGVNTPAVDIFEDKEELIFRCELPGMEQKDVEVVLEDGSLTIRGQRKLNREDRRENYLRIESSYGQFTRSFALPVSVDKDKIRADMKNGVLEVHVPKREGAKGKTIPIHT